MRKHRVKKNTPDDKLVEKCNEMTKQSCSPPGWDFYKDQEIHIEDNCPALIVDMEQSSGSVRFSERLTNTYLDMVGQDNKGMVIVCFDDELQVVCFGECRVGKVLKTDSSATKLSLVDGAEELDFPGEAATILDDLRDEIREITPSIQQKGVKILYSYGTPESCRKLLSAIGQHKEAQKIEETLSTVQLRPRHARMPRPEIFGVGRTGIYNSRDFAGVAVLITDAAEIVITTGNKRVSHEWKPGKILLLMPDTSLQLKDKDGTGNTEADGKRMDKDLKPSVFFYTMIPVEQHHP